MNLLMAIPNYFSSIERNYSIYFLYALFLDLTTIILTLILSIK